MPVPAIVPVPGGSTSNSYVTLDEYKVFLDSRLHSPSGISDDDLTRALLMAAARVDQENFVGQRTYTTQSMAFPRSGVVVDGQQLSGSAIPYQVKLAQMVEASGFNSDTGPVGGRNELAGLRQVKVDVITVTVADGVDVAAAQSALLPETKRLLRPFLLGIGVTVLLERS